MPPTPRASSLPMPLPESEVQPRLHEGSDRAAWTAVGCSVSRRSTDASISTWTTRSFLGFPSPRVVQRGEACGREQPGGVGERDQ